MKRLLTCLIGLLALTTSSCSFASFPTATPKDLIGQTVNCPFSEKANAEGFKVLSTQPWSQGMIVLYSALCPLDNAKTVMRPVFGHKVVQRHGTTWQVSSSGSYGAEEPAPAAQLVEYGISRSSSQHSVNSSSQREESYTILYGRALKPKVVAVEATFDNGKTLRGESSNNVFALLSAGATGVCALRILGADNQILRQEDLAVPKQLDHWGVTTKCLPMTHQL